MAIQCLPNSTLVTLAVAIAWIFPASGQAAPVLPAEMEHAIQSAMKTNPEVTSADSDVLAAGSQVKAGEYRWYPKAVVSNNVGKMVTSSTTRNDSNRYNNLGLKQTLWDAGKLDAGFDNTKSNKLVAVSQEGSVMESVGMRAAVAYLDVLRTREQLKVAQRNVAEHNTLFSSISNRKTGGLGTKSDVTLATTKLQQARATAELWKGEIEKAEAVYLSVVGAAPESTMPLLKLWDVPGGKEGVVNQIKQRSPSLAKLRNEVEAAKANVRSQQAQLYPTVYAQADNTHYFGGVSPSTGNTNDFRVSINIEWQNDVALSQRYQVDAAQHKVEAAQNSVLAEERTLIQQGSVYWDDYTTARQREKELTQFSISAGDTVQLFKRQFTIGRRSWPEVMNSQEDLYSAQSQLTEAKYNVLSTRMRLAFVGGEMDEYLNPDMLKLLKDPMEANVQALKLPDY